MRTRLRALLKVGLTSAALVGAITLVLARQASDWLARADWTSGVAGTRAFWVRSQMTRQQRTPRCRLRTVLW